MGVEDSWLAERLLQAVFAWIRCELVVSALGGCSSLILSGWPLATSCIVLHHGKLSLDPTRGLSVLMSEYLCFFLRISLLCRCLSEFSQSGGFTALLRTGSVVLFVSACLLIKCLYFWWNWLKTCFHWNMLGRVLVSECGFHPPLIPGGPLKVLTEIDTSWTAWLCLRLKRLYEVKQCFLYLSDTENCLELSLKLRTSRSFPSLTEPELRVCLTKATVYLEPFEEPWNGQISLDWEFGGWNLASCCHFLMQIPINLFNTSRP